MESPQTGAFQINELVTTQEQEAGLAISEDTKTLMALDVSENTLKAYRRAMRSLETWLNGRVLNAPLIVTCINLSW